MDVPNSRYFTDIRLDGLEKNIINGRRCSDRDLNRVKVDSVNTWANRVRDIVPSRLHNRLPLLRL